MGDPDWPPPLPDSTYRIEALDLHIAEADQVFWCLFGSFEEEIAFDSFRAWTNSPLVHDDHILMKSVPEDEPHEDGDLVDCRELGAWWSTAPTLFEAVGREERGWELEEGLAFVMPAGHRWVMDSHYINPSSEPTTADSIIDLGLVEIDSVEHIAGAYSLDAGGGLEVAPGEDSFTFDCAWPTQVQVLSISPHMHEWGASQTVDILRGDGSVDRLLDMPVWDPELREGAPAQLFGEGGIPIFPGDVFRTTCSWDNTTGAPLHFPEEMCTTTGVGYPLPDGWSCEPGDGDGGRGQLAVTVDLQVDTAGDQTGELVLLLFGDDPALWGDGPLAPPIVSGSYPDVDLSATDSSAFMLLNIPTRDEPYFMHAFLDEDGSGADGGPTSGDPFIESAPIRVPTSRQVTLDLVFDSLKE